MDVISLAAAQKALGQIRKDRNPFVSELTTDTTITTPGYITYHAGAFTVQRDEPLKAIYTASPSYTEAAGGKGVVRLLHGLASLSPLATNVQDILKAGVTAVPLGAVGFGGSTVGGSFAIDGYSPGDRVAFEIQAAVVGYAQHVLLPEEPNVRSIACSQTPTVYDGTRIVGDYFIAARGLTKCMLVRSNHGLDSVEDRLIAHWTLPVEVAGNPTPVAITPDGTKVVCPSYNADTVSVFDVASRTETVYSLPATVTDPSGVTISTDNTTAYIVALKASSGALYTMNLATGAFTFRVDFGGTAPLSPVISPDGLRLWVGRYFQEDLKVILLSTWAVEATRALPAGGFLQMRMVKPSAWLGTTIGFATVGGGKMVPLHVDGTIGATITPGAVLPNTQDFDVLNDGRSIITTSANASPNNNVLHLYTPGISEYIRWGSVNAAGVIQKCNAIGLSPTGSIYLSAGPELWVFFGGVFHLRPTSVDFLNEHSRLEVEGAVA